MVQTNDLHHGDVMLLNRNPRKLRRQLKRINRVYFVRLAKLLNDGDFSWPEGTLLAI